jgi:molecular chaperone HscC
VQAGLKMKDKALDEMVMTDVCPYTLGTEVMRQLDNGTRVAGFFAPVIQRNSVVPVSRIERFSPVEATQKQIRIGVFQGESRMVRDNIPLGEITVPLALGAGHADGVDVRFTYDVNGLLEVEVTVVATGDVQRLVIENGEAHMRPEEIAERLQALAALKVHPRDALGNRSLLARAERLYEQLLGDVRDQLGGAILQFEQTLAAQEPRAIARDATAFRAALDTIEHDSHVAFDKDD